MKTEHYPVFDCAIGDRAIHYMGHVKMMGAVQPFISRCDLEDRQPARSRPRSTRSRSSSSTPGSSASRRSRSTATTARSPSRCPARATASAVALLGKPQRRRLPDDRTEVGRKFRVGDYEGYIHVGLFEDGTPGDIFVDIAKEGTTLAGLMNSFMISVSLGLQYGVPLEVYVSKFSHMRFEPSGATNDADIRIAKSLVDYIFRWLGKKFLDAETQQELGIMSPEVKRRLAEALRHARERRGRSRLPRPRRLARADRALQRLGGRGRVRQVRRPDGQDRLVLHLPRLR